MKRSISLWQFWGFIAVGIGGTLLHYVYEWSNESVFIAPFSGVNESTWEHMKLLFFPLLIFAIIESRYFKEYNAFWCIKLIGTVFGILMIPIMFYTLNGAFGMTPDWVNIAIFFVSAAEALILESWLFKREMMQCERPWIAFLGLCIIVALFVIFTFKTPMIPLFEDPLTGTYGI